MAKILLVEDDNNLREIYEARLMAEGYDIVSARDGEEALSVAIKEKPDLVISDVMMPKISGFDMLDILRTTEETKDVKVIMMTALSQAEDKQRAEKLGADRYLVKSQVTLEDVAKVAKEVLEGKPQAEPAPEPMTVKLPEPTPAPTPAAIPVPEPVVTAAPEPVAAAPEPPVSIPVPEPVAVVTPASDPASPADSTVDAEEKAIAEQLESIVAGSVANAIPATQPAPEPIAVAPEPPATPETEPTAVITTPEPPTTATEPEPVADEQNVSTTSTEAESSANDVTVTPVEAEVKSLKKVIEPINDLNADMKPKLDELLAKEEEREASAIAAPIVTQQVGSTTPAGTGNAEKNNDPIVAPGPDTKIDPNSIAL